MTADPARTRPWTAAERAGLDRAPLVRVAVARPDGTLRGAVLVGHVRVGDDELIRSLNGPDGSWFRAALRTGRGELEIEGRRTAVAFDRLDGREAQVDAALRARYGDDEGVRRMTREPARSATLRVAPLAD
jgi:hypothetical protein